MNATREDTNGDWTALVVVRIPRDDGDELFESVRRRLEAGSTVEDVDVVALRGLEPALSATIVRADVRITVADHDDATVEDRLTDAPGVQRVEQLRRA